MIELALKIILKMISGGSTAIKQNKELNALWVQIRSDLFEGYKMPSKATDDFNRPNEF